jgi:hypothetical protein
LAGNSALQISAGWVAAGSVRTNPVRLLVHLQCAMGVLVVRLLWGFAFDRLTDRHTTAGIPAIRDPCSVPGCVYRGRRLSEAMLLQLLRRHAARLKRLLLEKACVHLKLLLGQAHGFYASCRPMASPGSIMVSHGISAHMAHILKLQGVLLCHCTTRHTEGHASGFPDKRVCCCMCDLW